MRKSFIALFLLLAGLAHAQDRDLWHLEDYARGSNSGIGWHKAQKMMEGQKAQDVIVAIIDAGVDIAHPDLRPRLWINPGEVAGNGLDDDGNGYIDDIHGWNFLGEVGYDNLEITRHWTRLARRFEGQAILLPEDSADYAAYLELTRRLDRLRMDAKSNYDFAYMLMRGCLQLEEDYGDSMTWSHIRGHRSENDTQELARYVLEESMRDGTPYPLVKTEVQLVLDQFGQDHLYYYNPMLDTRQIVGDDYNDPWQRHYGNALVYLDSQFSSHGTHVAGIVAALPADPERGAVGIAPHARIMSLRVVPQGDERDKDVANAIFYAVDQGARVINMSFGKEYVYRPEVLDSAFHYAQQHDVLLVHGAGNESSNNDQVRVYPNDMGGKYDANWLEVGASSWEKRPDKLAYFSNYGPEEVDLFAPGMSIYSTLPEGARGPESGTSMASPVVAGMAAYIWGYYPELSASQVRDAIIQGCRPIRRKQLVPGSDQKDCANELSVTGGQAYLPGALKEAARMR